MIIGGINENIRAKVSKHFTIIPLTHRNTLLSIIRKERLITRRESNA